MKESRQVEYRVYYNKATPLGPLETCDLAVDQESAIKLARDYQFDGVFLRLEKRTCHTTLEEIELPSGVPWGKGYGGS